MIENIEHTIIKYLQNLPCRDFITTLMRLVSIPFNLVPFFLIILVLYYYRKISSCQVLIIIMSQLLTNPHDSLTIDLQRNSPATYRINGYEKITSKQLDDMVKELNI